MVTSTSASLALERTHRSALALPMSTASDDSGALTNATALPAAAWRQSYLGSFDHRSVPAARMPRWPAAGSSTNDEPDDASLGAVCDSEPFRFGYRRITCVDGMGQ